MKLIIPIGLQIIAARAGQFEWSGELNYVLDFTDEDRAVFTARHNYWRNKAAAGELNGGIKALDMPPVYWDMELERSAKAFAAECGWTHSKAVGFDGGFPDTYNENLAQINYQSPSSLENPVDQWASEHKDYNHITKECTDGAQCGHYTQVVWSGTTRVGCGIASCSSLPPLGSGSIVVCQYYQPGNYPSQLAYNFALNDEAAGVNCEGGAGTDSTLYPALCTADSNGIRDPCHESTNRCDQGTCVSNTPSLSGYNMDYTCDCKENFVGRWCSESTCSTKVVEGKHVTGWSDIYNDGGLKFWMSSQQDEALNWCDTVEGCAGVTLRPNGGNMLLFAVRKIVESEWDELEGTLVAWRECTEAPTNAPTEAPTEAPTAAPTEALTEAPTEALTDAPTAAPTQAPTEAPTDAPTAAPTQALTDAPTEAHTEAPTAAPCTPNGNLNQCCGDAESYNPMDHFCVNGTLQTEAPNHVYRFPNKDGSFGIVKTYPEAGKGQHADAVSFCNGQSGGVLPSLQTQAQYDAVNWVEDGGGLHHKNGFWISAAWNGSTFAWPDGSAYNDPSNEVSFWGVGGGYREPNGFSREPCTQFYFKAIINRNNYHINDIPCSRVTPSSFACYHEFGVEL